ncbi:MAG: HAD family phosphatase [Bacillota bacterium]
MIKNIIFDMGHVLFWYEPMRACRALTANEADAQALRDAFSGGPLWVEVDCGRLDGEAFTGAVKALLDARLHPAVDALYRGQPENVLFPVEGMAEVVDATLGKGYKVYLLSNAGLWMSRRRAFIPHIGRFHGVMFSADEGLVKPDPRLYRRLMERYGLKPAECFFIDDNEANVQAAAALSWRTHLFTGDVDALKAELDAL